MLNDAFRRFSDLADRKKIVHDEDIAALVDDEIVTANDRVKVVALTVIAGTNGPQSAALTDIDGEKVDRTRRQQWPGRRTNAVLN